MGAKFIQCLERIVEKYQYDKMRRIIAFLVMAMLKIRKSQSYLAESMSAAQLAISNMKMSLSDHRVEIRDEFAMEILEVVQFVYMFPHLTDEEAAEIAEYCEGIVPEKTSNLESFLRDRFNVSTSLPVSRLLTPNSLQEMQSVLLTSIFGVYEERFVMSTQERIATEHLLTAAAEYFKGKDFQMYEMTDFSVTVEKGDCLMNVVLSNYGDSIHVSVENIG